MIIFKLKGMKLNGLKHWVITTIQTGSCLSKQYFKKETNFKHTQTIINLLFAQY